MDRRGHVQIVARRLLLAGAFGLCAVTPGLAAGSSTQAVHARLTPVAPAKQGSGSFTASGGSGQTVVVRWQLSVSRLSGPVRKATLRTPAPHSLVFALCSPCAAKAHGQLALLGSMWSRIVAGGGTVVVTTRAHPNGELRGAVKRG